MATVPRGVSEKIIIVEITPNGTIPDYVAISKSRKEEVEWHSQRASIVRFPAAKSPFKKSEFFVPTGGSVRSGVANSEADVCDTCAHHQGPNHAKGHHPYEIHEHKGPVVLDPQIIILP